MAGMGGYVKHSLKQTCEVQNLALLRGAGFLPFLSVRPAAQRPISTQCSSGVSRYCHSFRRRVDVSVLLVPVSTNGDGKSALQFLISCCVCNTYKPCSTEKSNKSY